jgi:hypothetical protein
LLDIPIESKVVKHDVLFSVRVEYQHPVKVKLKESDNVAEAISGTFEDALVFENLELFRNIEGTGPVAEIREAVRSSSSLPDLGKKMFEILKELNKARLALDLLWLREPSQLTVPTYINDGLHWLNGRLAANRNEVIGTSPAAPKKQ